jgi:hypothetical protein
MKRQGGEPVQEAGLRLRGDLGFERDLDYYENKLGARLLWNLSAFGARVAAFDLCGELYLLLADHVRAPQQAPHLRGRVPRGGGEGAEAPRMGAGRGTLRDTGGPCIRFKDGSGNEYAMLQMTRPLILEKETARGGNG